jgi:hypothetical protein
MQHVDLRSCSSHDPSSIIIALNLAGLAVGLKDVNCHQALCYDDPKPGGESYWTEGCDQTQVVSMNEIKDICISFLELINKKVF